MVVAIAALRAFGRARGTRGTSSEPLHPRRPRRARFRGRLPQARRERLFTAGIAGESIPPAVVKRPEHALLVEPLADIARRRVMQILVAIAERLVAHSEHRIDGRASALARIGEGAHEAWVSPILRAVHLASTRKERRFEERRDPLIE